MKKETLTRTQVLLEPAQLKELARIAKEEKKSLSALLRDLIHHALADRDIDALRLDHLDILSRRQLLTQLIGHLLSQSQIRTARLARATHGARHVCKRICARSRRISRARFRPARSRGRARAPRPGT